MINTTDLQEVEVLLSGDWQREDNGDVYSFTADKMEMKDGRLFRQLVVGSDETQWALAIKDDYCAIIAGDDEFIIREIGEQGGETRMLWEEVSGPLVIRFKKRSS